MTLFQYQKCTTACTVINDFIAERRFVNISWIMRRSNYVVLGVGCDHTLLGFFVDIIYTSITFIAKNISVDYQCRLNFQLIFIIQINSFWTIYNFYIAVFIIISTSLTFLFPFFVFVGILCIFCVFYFDRFMSENFIPSTISGICEKFYICCMYELHHGRCKQ
jgi:hypothetical protein